MIDGALHRCPTADKPQGKDGAYIAHGDEPASIWWQNWRTGHSDTWTAKGQDKLTKAEREALTRRMEATRKAREAEQARVHVEAAAKAQAIYAAAATCEEHPYLTAKQVKAVPGLKLHKGALVVPVHDENGKAVSLQFIGGDGTKRFLTGGRKRGCFFSIGGKDIAKPLLICEGLATGLSLYESVGLPVLVAFDAGNLQPVAEMARTRYPERDIVLCADNDCETGGNPGVAKATAAALAVAGYLAVPRHEGRKVDWNDLHHLMGAGEVSSQLANRKKPEPPKAESPQPAARVFHFLSLGELLAAPRPTRWLIRDYLEADTLGVLFGEAGTMKSFLAIDQGLCIASGKPWHGHAVPNPGAVFYLCGEGFAGVAKRIKAWTVAHDADPANIPFFVSNSPAQLLDGESAQAVSDAVATLAEQHGPPRLVIIDTLNRNFGDGDENSSQDMTAFVAALDALKARFGCSILTVHHSGLANGDRSRGSFVLRAAADFEYKLAVKGDVRVLSCTKSKDHEPPEGMAFEPEAVELPGWTDFETLEVMTSCVLRQVDMPATDDSVKLGAAKRIALEALRELCRAPGASVPVDAWRDAAISRGISASELRKVQLNKFREAKIWLTENGIVQETEGLWSLTEEAAPRHPNGTQVSPGAKPLWHPPHPLSLERGVAVPVVPRGELLYLEDSEKELPPATSPPPEDELDPDWDGSAEVEI